MADPTVDEKCLELAAHCLADERWTPEDQENLAHALQQTVMDFIQIFSRGRDEDNA